MLYVVFSSICAQYSHFGLWKPKNVNNYYWLTICYTYHHSPNCDTPSPFLTMYACVHVHYVYVCIMWIHVLYVSAVGRCSSKAIVWGQSTGVCTLHTRPEQDDVQATDTNHCCRYMYIIIMASCVSLCLFLLLLLLLQVGEVRDMWVSKVRRLLTGQFYLLKGETHHTHLHVYVHSLLLCTHTHM